MQDARHGGGRRRRPAGLAAALLIVGGGLTGCAATPAGPPAGAAAGAAAAAEPGPTETLRSQAERDVQDVLRRPPDSSGASEAGRAPRDLQAIQWSSPAPRPRPAELPAATGPAPEPPGAPSAGPGPVAAAAATSPPLARPADEAPDVTTPAAVTAPSPTRQDRVAELIVELSGELYRQSSYADQPLRELLAIAAASMVRPERGLTPEAFRTLTPREQEILQRFQDFFRQLGRDLDASHDSEAVVIEALAALRSSLVREPTLTIADAALCYQVGGFGSYDAFDRFAFLAHQEQQVILYLGIEDFTSKRNQRGEWVTELAQQLVIYSDADGIPVWSDDWQTAVDRSRTERQDFFTVQVIALPTALGVGRYHLKVRLRDEQSGAETESSVTFEMVADPKLAARVP